MRRLAAPSLVLVLAAACAAAHPGPPGPRPAGEPDATDALRARLAAARLPYPVPAPEPRRAPRPGHDLPRPDRPHTTLAAWEPRLDAKDVEASTRTPVEVASHWLLSTTPALAEDGTLTLEARTHGALRGGRVSFGMELAGPRQRERVLRKRRPLATAGDLHAARFALPGLLAAKYDVAGVRARGHGVVHWRLELWDEAEGTARLSDGRLAFRCPAPCDAGPFVALPTVVRGPFLDVVTSSRAVVSFDTDVPTAAVVELRGDDGVATTFSSTSARTRHEVELSGLSPGRSYRYALAVRDHRGEVSADPGGAFAAAPARGDRAEVVFAVLSDSRSGLGGGLADYHGVNRAALEPLLRLASSRGAAFAVFAGDMSDGYTTLPGAWLAELDAWKAATEGVAHALPIYEVPGNHELLMDAWDEGWAANRRDVTTEALFARAFVNPENGPSGGAAPYREVAYGFDHGDLHLAVVDTNHDYRSHHHQAAHPAAGRGTREGYLDDAQLAWLDADLAAARARGARRLFVFTHEPAYPNGGHREDAMYWEGRFPEVLARRDAFWRVLERHGVTAAFFGDEHNYSRMRPAGPDGRGTVWHVTTGGAGAPYYAQDRDVPWAGEVVAFEHAPHLVLLRVRGDAVDLEAVSLSGEVLDRAALAR